MLLAGAKTWKGLAAMKGSIDAPRSHFIAAKGFRPTREDSCEASLLGAFVLAEGCIKPVWLTRRIVLSVGAIQKLLSTCGGIVERGNISGSGLTFPRLA